MTSAYINDIASQMFSFKCWYNKFKTLAKLGNCMKYCALILLTVHTVRIHVFRLSASYTHCTRDKIIIHLLWLFSALDDADIALLKSYVSIALVSLWYDPMDLSPTPPSLPSHTPIQRHSIITATSGPPQSATLHNPHLPSPETVHNNRHLRSPMPPHSPYHPNLVTLHNPATSLVQWHFITPISPVWYVWGLSVVFVMFEALMLCSLLLNGCCVCIVWGIGVVWVSFPTSSTPFLLQGAGMYSRSIKQIEDDIQASLKKVNELSGIKESNTGLAPPALWDLTADKHTLHSAFTPHITEHRPGPT